MVQWAAAAKSIRGIREENQDNYLLISPQGNARYFDNQQEQMVPVSAWNNQFIRLAIADGVGGHRQGREMAENVIQGLLTLPPQHNPVTFRENLYQLHDELLTRFYQPGQQNPGSTLVVADINIDGQATLAHIGDSRAMLRRNSVWHTLTHDHVQAEFDWRDGIIDREVEPQNTATKPMLAQAIGYGSYGLIADEYGYRPLQLNKRIRMDLADELTDQARHHADIFTLQLTPGDSLLFATDGLLGTEAITACPEFTEFEPRQENVYLQALMDAALAQGSQDNITTLLVRCMDNHDSGLG